MRDILVTLIIFGTIPYILSRPYIGVYVLSWLGYMNPHRLTWGFAYNMPFSTIIALTLFVSMFFSKDKYTFPKSKLTTVWILFVLWAVVTTVFAINLEGALEEFTRFIKIQIIILCTMLLINNKDKLIYLVWVIALSIGFYSIKGGVFSIASGLQYRVLGPEKSFISENNTLALAILTILPLMYFLFLHYKNKYIKAALLAGLLLSLLSVIASYSRGAFVAMSVLLFFLWLGSRHKLIIAMLIVILAASVIPFVPDKWFDRMDSISTYEVDKSVQGRFDAWEFAINVANDNPLVGGGFRVFTPELFQIYMPEKEGNADAHSIYFEVLGEQGYVGLILFLSIWLLTFIQAYKIKRRTKNIVEMKWMFNLVSMAQLSLIAYMTGGAFLGLAYFDLPYHLMSIVVICGVLYKKYEVEKNENVPK